MTFSEKLIRLRKREGVSQEELASYLEVSRQAVSRWEQGTALPDAGNLLKLRQRFRVSVDWLLTEERAGKRWKENRRHRLPVKVRGRLRSRRNGKISCHGQFLWEFQPLDCCFWEFSHRFFRRNM